MSIQLITVELTLAELESLPIELRQRISRRWKRRVKEEKKHQEFLDSLDIEEDP